MKRRIYHWLQIPVLTATHRIYCIVKSNRGTVCGCRRLSFKVQFNILGNVLIDIYIISRALLQAILGQYCVDEECLQPLLPSLHKTCHQIQMQIPATVDRCDKSNWVETSPVWKSSNISFIDLVISQRCPNISRDVKLFLNHKLSRWLRAETEVMNVSLHFSSNTSFMF